MSSAPHPSQMPVASQIPSSQLPVGRSMISQIPPAATAYPNPAPQISAPQLPVSRLPVGQSKISQLLPSQHVALANKVPSPLLSSSSSMPVAMPPQHDPQQRSIPQLPVSQLPIGQSKISQLPPASMPFPSTIDLPAPPSAASTPPSPQRAARKRPASAEMKQPPKLSDKKLRRLEKNRLSARECRRRKREATEQLEHEINLLEGDNLRLRLQLRIGEEAEQDLSEEQSKVTQEIDDLLKSGASEGEIYNTIEEFKEKFADYGRDRRSAIDFHLANVERLLQPTQTTSVAMRALHGGTRLLNAEQQGGGRGVETVPFEAAARSTPESIATAQPSDTAPVPNPTPEQPIASTAESAAATRPCSNITSASNSTLDSSLLEPKKLFQYLVSYLEVTPEQAAALKDSRLVARDLDDSLAKSLSVLQELRDRLTQIGAGMETEFNNVRSILTPTQAAKFLVWVANNRACMHMLNELWSRVYPDPSNGSAAVDDDRKPESS